MATSGVKQVQFTEYDTLQYSWQVVSYSPTTKKSTISWKAEIISGSNGAIQSSYSKDWNLKVTSFDVIGTQYDNGTAYINIGNNETKVIASGTYEVPHTTAANGNHSWEFSIGMYITFAGQEVNVVTVSGKQSIGAPPSGGALLNATNFTDEENPVIEYALDYTFMDSVKAELLVGTRSIVRNIPATSSGSYTFELTDEERNAIRTICANSISAPVNFYLVCVYGNETYVSNLTRTVTIVNAYPTLNPTVTNSRGTDFVLKGDNELTVAFNAAARKGATITNKYVTYDGKKSSSGYITDVNNEVIKVTVVDSRGLSTTKEITLQMIPYVKLTCVIESHRSGIKDDNTVDITFDVSGAFYNGSFNDGGSGNAITLEYRYKENSSDYSDYIWKEVTINGNSYSTEIVFNTAYQNEIILEAKVTDNQATVITTSDEVKVVPVFDWSKEDFNFNVPVTIMGSEIPTIVEAGSFTSGGTFYYRKWSDGWAEIWGRKNFTYVDVQSVWADANYGLYTSTGLSGSNIKYPTNFFIEKPYVQVSLDVGDVGGILMSPGGSGEYKSSITQTGIFEIARGTPITGATFNISYYIKGRWRE